MTIKAMLDYLLNTVVTKDAVKRRCSVLKTCTSNVMISIYVPLA